MNLSSRSRYGIRALIDLAINAKENCIQLGDIAARNEISVKYLEQIFMVLRKGGIIRSIKGPSGGYLLAKEPKNIRISEVIRLLDGDYLMEDEANISSDKMSMTSRVVQSQLIDPINEWISGFLEDLTLQKLLKAYEEENSSYNDMYYI